MDADLTFNSIVFKKSFDEKGGSERRSTARGINTPDLLLIKTQAYVDSQTKVAGTRYTYRIDYWELDANNTLVCTSMYAVIPVPSTASSGALTSVVATFKAAVADATFTAAVLNGEK